MLSQPSLPFPCKILVSEATANLIKAAGKEHWLRPREDAIRVIFLRLRVHFMFVMFVGFNCLILCCVVFIFFHQAKGKGLLKTYFASPQHRNSTGSVGSSVQDSVTNATPTESISRVLPPAQSRLVDWIAKLLLDDIRKIVSFNFAKTSISSVAS